MECIRRQNCLYPARNVYSLHVNASKVPCHLGEQICIRTELRRKYQSCHSIPPKIRACAYRRELVCWMEAQYIPLSLSAISCCPCMQLTQASPQDLPSIFGRFQWIEGCRLIRSHQLKSCFIALAASRGLVLGFPLVSSSPLHLAWRTLFIRIDYWGLRG